MSHFTFEYDTFYNYYTDINNPNIYTTDVTESNVELHYYINGKLKTTTLSNRYIKVNGIDIYIKINPKNRDILFTTPHKIDDKIYDFHYHFGMRHEHIIEKQRITDNWHFLVSPLKSSNKTKKNKSKNKYLYEEHILSSDAQIKTDETKESSTLTEQHDINPEQIYIDMSIPLIFFHKTIQNPNIPNKDKNNNIKSYGNIEHIKCYFKQKSKITNTNNIICIDEKSKIMKTAGFGNEELNQIHEIILRPFMPHGGRKLKRRRHTKKNKKYNVIR